MRDGASGAGANSWRAVLRATAVALSGPERAAALEEEIARMAEALDRLASEELDLREPVPDLGGVPGEERE